MNDGEALRQRAQKLLAEQRLPRTPPRRTWVGYGTGQSCALCGRMTDPSEREVEIEYEIDAGVRTYLFHQPCRDIWETERLRFPSR